MTEKFTCIFQGKPRCHQYPLLKSYKWMLPSAIPLMGQTGGKNNKQLEHRVISKTPQPIRCEELILKRKCNENKHKSKESKSKGQPSNAKVMFQS